MATEHPEDAHLLRCCPGGPAASGGAPAEAVRRTRHDIRRTVRLGMVAARLKLFGAVSPQVAARMVDAADLPIIRRFIRDARGWLDAFEAALPPREPRRGLRLLPPQPEEE